ncbi:hypothetical protein [Massilia sp. METH4]|uniref:hypothetical protein n=1 Tax=Massilia sp. METH4 TaxID=3123041 RepID=UPI0030D5EB31
MTTIEINLPRDLAEEAAEMGLLKSQVVADLLRDEIRRRTFSDLMQHGGYAANSHAAPDEPERAAPPRRRKG